MSSTEEANGRCELAEGDWIDESGRVHERIYVHDGISGWHHHHLSSTGIVLHDTDSTDEFVDEDGTVLVCSSHGADHDDLGSQRETPCRDNSCRWVATFPIDALVKEER